MKFKYLGIKQTTLEGLNGAVAEALDLAGYFCCGGNRYFPSQLKDEKRDIQSKFYKKYSHNRGKYLNADYNLWMLNSNREVLGKIYDLLRISNGEVNQYDEAMKEHKLRKEKEKAIKLLGLDKEQKIAL